MRYFMILLLLLSAACNNRFVADFESDTVGAPPPLNPPGPPDDEIALINSNTDNDGTVIRITDEPQLVGLGQPHRFMSLIREENPGLTSSASLHTRPMATATQSIFLTWQQVLDGVGTGQVNAMLFRTHRRTNGHCAELLPAMAR